MASFGPCDPSRTLPVELGILPSNTTNEKVSKKRRKALSLSKAATGRQSDQTVIEYATKDDTLQALAQSYGASDGAERYFFNGSFTDCTCPFNGLPADELRREDVDAYIHGVKGKVAAQVQLIFVMHDTKPRHSSASPYAIRYRCAQDEEHVRPAKDSTSKAARQRKKRAPLDRYACHGRLSVTYHPETSRTSLRFSHDLRHSPHPSFLRPARPPALHQTSSLIPPDLVRPMADTHVSPLHTFVDIDHTLTLNPGDVPTDPALLGNFDYSTFGSDTLHTL